jgi:hypothetical protein
MDAVRTKGLNAGYDREYMSWENSMEFMSNAIDCKDIDDEVQICIEYNIPMTSKRVDFIIAGADEAGNENLIIVELKQWQKAEIVNDEMHYSVRTWVAHDNRVVCHPSYQAYSYSCFLKNFSETVHNEKINLFPCAYLHNYQSEYSSTLSNPIYQDWIREAPFFIENEKDMRVILKNTEPEPHWIPATERLPEEDGVYLVTTSKGQVQVHVFNHNGNSEEYWMRCNKAWMPLPEPYRGE